MSVLQFQQMSLSRLHPVGHGGDMAKHDETPGHRYDVVIIGGGAAGLNGALMLARARRSVLVVDDRRPRNAPAAHLHGFLSRDGQPPGELLEIGRREVLGYGGEIITGRAVSANRVDGEVVVELHAGPTVRARRLLVATGVTDELPDIPGIAARWGRDVLHCPYCHGWEIRDQPIGVLATNPFAVHQALLFRQWTGDVTLLSHNGPAPSESEREQLAARDVTVVPGEVTALEITDDRLVGVRLHDGTTVPVRGLAVTPRPVPRAEVLAGLGLTPSAHPAGLGEAIAAEATGRTEVPGVWVAGNLANPMTQVLASAAAGATAAAAINADLVAEDVSAAVRARKNPFSHVMEERVSAAVVGDRRHGVAP
jgi:thioredoxin reductase